MLSRRRFLKLSAGAAALVAVPAKVAALLPADAPTIYADGIHCDAAGIEALFRGDPVHFLSAEAAERIRIHGDVFDFGEVWLYTERTVHAVLRGGPTTIKNMRVYAGNAKGKYVLMYVSRGQGA